MTKKITNWGTISVVYPSNHSPLTNLYRVASGSLTNKGYGRGGGGSYGGSIFDHILLQWRKTSNVQCIFTSLL